MKSFILIIASLVLLSSCGNAKTEQKKPTSFKVSKTQAEWKKQLTPEQYEVTREEGTERPYTGKYHDHHENGIYTCICCGISLFDSKAKFESGTGWPSYYQPIDKKNVLEVSDTKLAMTRTEVECAGGGAGAGESARWKVALQYRKSALHVKRLHRGSCCISQGNRGGIQRHAQHTVIS